MFGLKPKFALGLPSAKEIAALHTASRVEWCRARPLPEEAKARLRVPDRAWDALSKLWSECKEPVQGSDGTFRVHIECHESREGFVILYAQGHPERDEFTVGFVLLDEENEVKLDMPYTDMPKPMLPDDEAYMDRIWKAVVPVLTIKKTEHEQRPNDPCKCGSGRKAKKCCLGRVEHASEDLPG